MTAEERLQQGDPEGALAELQDQVRNDPANAKHRIFLFQLLAVSGEWERAMTQLNVLADLDAESLLMVQTYRAALINEALRHEIYAGTRTPLVFGEPESWTAQIIEALRLESEGSFAQAKALRDQAFEEAPATSGTVDGNGFEWIADADTRLGPLIEAVVDGKFFWVPFHRIKRITIEAPVDLRDVVWAPAGFTWANGGQAAGLIPTRYPGSERSGDGRIRLARKTDWQEVVEGSFHGEGQRMLATDAGEYPLMDVREILLDSAAPEPADG